MYPQVKKGP